MEDGIPYQVRPIGILGNAFWINKCTCLLSVIDE
jgi:hypothetical protein